MRDKDTPATLGEVMGKKTRPQGLQDLPEMLGEKMPKLEFSELGRMRLLRALHSRYGDGYRNLPGVSNIIKEFDHELKYKKAIRANRRK